jgi:outer membrane protein, multidrug efflux system
MTQQLLIRTGIAVLLCVIAGCTTVGPDYRISQQAAVNRDAASSPFSAANESSFDTGALPGKWWKLYRDGTLDGLIGRAFSANADLRAASANLARAQAIVDEAREARRPDFSVSAAPSYGRISGAAEGSPDSVPDMWMYDAGIRIGYQVDLFGKITRAIEAAGADAQATQAAYDLVRINVAANTARAYLSSCSLSRQIAVAQRSVNLQKQFVQLTGQLIRAGRGTALDDSRARAQLEQLRAALPPLEAQRRSALFQLAVLIGEVPGALPAEFSACKSVPMLDSPIPVGDGKALLRRRPDIRQAERGLAGATARIGVATADLYPDISLGLSVGSTGTLERFGASNAFRWSLGPLISWTIPVTGPARSRIAQAEAGSQAALARFDVTVLNALRETETALNAYARELDRNAALKAARDQSALASQQARTLYRVGRTDFLTTLDADRTLAGAESALAASDAQLTANQLALFLALGGGWQED